MSSPLTLENLLLLACARTEPEARTIQKFVEHDPDWEEILRKAERFGLASLVYTSLKQAVGFNPVPKPIAERLRHLCHRDAIRSIALRETLRAVLLRFSEAGIPVIVLKGAALAALVYPSPALRTMGDIDLLTLRGDLDKADELLRTMGYAPDSAEVSISGAWPEQHHDIPYLGGAGLPTIEIHHHIFRPRKDPKRQALFARIPIEDFWERSRPVQIASVATHVFSPEDLLLHLTLHVSERDGFFGHVRTLCDIREICRRYSNEIDWSQIISQAKAYQVGKYLYYTLCLARDLLDAGVPPWVLTDLRASFGQLPLEGKLIGAVTRQAILSEDRTEVPAWPWTLYQTGVDLLAARRARDGIMTACRVLTGSCRVHLQRAAAGYWKGVRRLKNSGGSELSSEEQPAAPDSCASRKPVESSLRPSGRDMSVTDAQGEVAVTYDAEAASDGVGSQLERIYAIYALARSLRIKYVHTPLGRVGYQGLMPLLAGRLDPDFVARYNAYYSLPSDPFDLESCERVRVHRVEQDTVEYYQQRSATTGRPVLIQGLLAYGYIRQHPEAYLALRAVSPYRDYRPAGPVRVCIHLRRGDNSLSGRSDGRNRWLPNAYYLRVCGPVVETLRQQGAPFVVRLHSEMPTRRYTLAPGTPGLYCRLLQPGTIDPAEYALEEFEALPNLEMVLNVEAREALDDFATADVLILSSSSLGYVAGMLNPHGLVIHAPWYHVPLPGWLVASEEGQLDEGRLTTRIAELLRRRGQN